jgi:hypothetical protein
MKYPKQKIFRLQYTYKDLLTGEVKKCDLNCWSQHHKSPTPTKESITEFHDACMGYHRFEIFDDFVAMEV